MQKKEEKIFTIDWTKPWVFSLQRIANTHTRKEKNYIYIKNIKKEEERNVDQSKKKWDDKLQVYVSWIFIQGLEKLLQRGKYKN